MELGAGGRYLRPLCSQEHGALCCSNREQEPGSIPHSALWPPWDGVEGIDWWCRGLTSKATLPYTARSCCSLGSCSAPCLWQEKPLSLLLTHTAGALCIAHFSSSSPQLSTLAAPQECACPARLLPLLCPPLPGTLPLRDPLCPISLFPTEAPTTALLPASAASNQL